MDPVLFIISLIFAALLIMIPAKLAPDKEYSKTTTRMFSAVSAVFFTLQALYYFIPRFYKGGISNLYAKISGIIMFAFAAILLIEEKNFILSIISTAAALLNIGRLIADMSLSNLLYLLTYASLTAVIVLKKKNSIIVKKIFCIPAYFLLANALTKSFDFMFEYLPSGNWERDYILWRLFYPMINDIMSFAGILFLVLWVVGTPSSDDSDGDYIV